MLSALLPGFHPAPTEMARAARQASVYVIRRTRIWHSPLWIQASGYVRPFGFHRAAGASTFGSEAGRPARRGASASDVILIARIRSPS